MDRTKAIEALNKALALEHAAAIQYGQHALLVSGLWRRVFAGFFADQSRSAQEHVLKFGEKVVALGGVPTVEVATVRQSTDLEEMLRQDLELERETMKAYLEAHAAAEGDVALRTMLETHIESEQRDIEELERYLGLVKTAGVEKEIHLRRAG